MKKNNNFQALHSPRGANAGFSIGAIKCGGGLGLQEPRIPTQDIYIGTYDGNELKMLPYFANATDEYRNTFVKSDNSPYPVKVNYYLEEEIDRTYTYAIDSFEAGDDIKTLKYSIYTPVLPIANPLNDSCDAVKESLVPGIISTLEVDNTQGQKDIQAIFALGGMRGPVYCEDEDERLIGFHTSDGFGLAARKDVAPNLQAVSDFDPMGVFGRVKPIKKPLPTMSGIIFDVPAGKKISIDIAFGWYIGHVVTRGLKRCRYYYTNFFRDINEVFNYSLEHAEKWKTESKLCDKEIESKTHLSDEQKFMIAHATRAYYTSTMIFDDDGKPLYVVNEGTFMMMNTFDLAIDHAFFELYYNPWVVENILEGFIENYSYYDTVHDMEGNVGLPGGISFTHDQGVHNVFTPKGYSSYEVTDQEGCFSYMTQEQLCNWILEAGCLYEKTRDINWVKKHENIFVDCFISMLNRDHYEPQKRDGIMDMDSDRCGGSSEITTYDSLDESLGQARQNLYVATKCWASYISLEKIFKELGQVELEEKCHSAALSAAKTICDNYSEEKGFIPAIFDGRDNSAIIPAIEALVYPYFSGRKDVLDFDGEYAFYLETLKKHFINIMKKGICLFNDNGWKLSSNNTNSWISKIFICQFVARNILKINDSFLGEESDIAHVNWWKVGCRTSPAIDQIFAGKVEEVGFHYPRAVTNNLWLQK